MRAALIFLSLQVLSVSGAAVAAPCPPDKGVALQVLGSGGPELDDGRASSGYLVWLDGKARLLIDMGGGSLARFEEIGADLNDLDLILLTHLHVDHSADLPQLIKASYFSGRQRDLPIYGPNGNDWMPPVDGFVQRLVGEGGAWRYLSDYVTGTESYRLLPRVVDSKRSRPQSILENERYRIRSVGVHHGPIPALAWRVDIAGHSIVISGDMNNSRHSLVKLAQGSDLLVAHHAIPESAGGVARKLHMPPSEIGRIAEGAGVGQLVLSHRMRRTYGVEAESRRRIRERYDGPLAWADDLSCYVLEQ